jgi:endoglucanase
MMKINKYLIYVLISIFLICCNKEEIIVADHDLSTTFFRVSQNKIIDGSNQPFFIKGVAFGNEVWSDNEIPNTHHSEVDYSRVKDLGMNVVRFYLNYKTLESDSSPYIYKSSGWQWIDQNINWAKAHGIYLILNIHVPQGGFQSMGNGDELWTNHENQNRLVLMWKAIADRYKNEKQILGYGLVNEPVPTQDISQWQQLAQRITNEIRLVDKNHILFIEKANYVKGKPETADYNFPAITDNNFVYEFHFYEPYDYTHQQFVWADLGDGGVYPDENLIASVSNTNWFTAIFNNPQINQGSSDWTYFTGLKYKITNTNIKLGLPALIGARVGEKVYFDDIEIKEYNPSGEFTRNIWQSQLDVLDSWFYWTEDNSGFAGIDNNTGISNNKSIFIQGGTADCNLSNHSALFETKQDYYYQINGWMKGDQISANAGCRLRLDFLSTNDPIYKRNKIYLENRLGKYVDYGISKNVPMFMGEFGAGIHCFQNDKGGLQWVNDMVDISKEKNLHFTYHVYHEDNFGIYFGYGALPNPSNANTQLINLFKNKLN